MDTIRVVAGTGRGPTGTAAYDAALADCGVHNYNLVRVSSVVPPGATVERVERAPDLGPVGGRLTVVQARATVRGPGVAGAALGWARTADGSGLFYEADEVGRPGGDPAARAADRVRAGLAAGLDLRDWDADEPTVVTASTAADGDERATAVVVGTYGRADPILGPEKD